MFVITSDGSVLDRDGRIVFFSTERFLSDIANGDCCFICGQERAAVPFNDEHVIPDWILRRFGLHGRVIEIPNETGFLYGKLTVPCCVACNEELGRRFEAPISQLFSGGFQAVSKALKTDGPWEVFCWMGLIFLKIHLKHKYLNFHLDRRKGDMKIAELHPWQELHHLHCVIRAFHSRATLEREILGSLLVIPVKVGEHLEGFDYLDLSIAQTLMLSIDDVAIIAVFNDSQGALTIALEHLQSAIGGPLSPIQVREVAARLAAINLQFEPRPRFVSDIDVERGTARIFAERPDAIYIPEWDSEVYGKILYKVSENYLNAAGADDVLRDAVRHGQFTFLVTADGAFNSRSMDN